jgi:hypothetical protein
MMMASLLSNRVASHSRYPYIINYCYTVGRVANFDVVCWLLYIDFVLNSYESITCEFQIE